MAPLVSTTTAFTKKSTGGGGGGGEGDGGSSRPTKTTTKKKNKGSGSGSRRSRNIRFLHVLLCGAAIGSCATNFVYVTLYLYNGGGGGIGGGYVFHPFERYPGWKIFTHCGFP